MAKGEDQTKIFNRTRSLHHQKAFRTIVGQGVPKRSEGADGDLQLRTTKAGLKLFARYASTWYQMGEAATKIAGIDGETPQSFNSISGTTRIDEMRGTLYLGANMVLGRPAAGSPFSSSVGNKNVVGIRSSRSINHTGKDNIGLTITPNDAPYVQGVALLMEQTRSIVFDYDSSSHTTISEVANDKLRFLVGGETLLDLTETTQNLIETFNSDLILLGNAASATGNSELQFITQRNALGTAAGQDGDDLGKIAFKGYNDAGTPELIEYASIFTEITDASDGSETADMTITTTGDLHINPIGSDVTIYDDTGLGDPTFILKGTSAGAYGPHMHFNHESSSPNASDILGKTIYKGMNDADEAVVYADLACQVEDVANGVERGSMSLRVLSEGLTYGGINITAPSAGRVDVNLGLHTASLTTIAGDLDIDGDAITSVGALEIDLYI